MGKSYGALQEKALAEGDTRWAQLQRERLQDQYTGGISRLGQQQAGQLAQARGNLAMRGGLGSGASERLAMQGQRLGMAGAQGLGRTLADQQLQTSIQDELMKNQMLGITGQAEQGIQEGNINRLFQDIQAQNEFTQSMYAEDMRAYAAQKSAQAAAPPSCFLADTKIVMADGSEKMIMDVKITDEIAGGGVVHFKSEALSEDLYRYKEEYVTGSHAVLEDGKFIRVKDSEHSKKIGGKFMVYCLGTENFRILTPNNVYADFFETADYDNLSLEESLEAMNATLG